MGNARSDVVRQAFNNGELSPLLDSRSDLEKAQGACRTLQNAIADSYGPGTRRTGLRFLVITGTGEDE